MLSSSRKKQTSVICWGANFYDEHFATYMLACIYITYWIYIYTHVCKLSDLKSTNLELFI